MRTEKTTKSIVGSASPGKSQRRRGPTSRAVWPEEEESVEPTKISAIQATGGSQSRTSAARVTAGSPGEESGSLIKLDDHSLRLSSEPGVEAGYHLLGESAWE